MAVGCVADSGLLSHLDAGRFSELMAQIRSLILATDIARQAEFIAQFQVSNRSTMSRSKPGITLHSLTQTLRMWQIRRYINPVTLAKTQKFHT